jgi:ABC-type transporter Mla subunit MlaD
MVIKKSALPLHTDATVKIRPRLFLEGGYYADLDAGSPSAPEMKDGGTIPYSNTAIPVQLNDVLSTLDEPNRNSFTGIVREFDTGISHGGAKSFNRFAPNLAPVLRDLAWVAKASLGTEPHDVSKLITNAAKVNGALAEHPDDLSNLISNLDQTSQALNSGNGALGRTISALDRVLQEAPPALTGIDNSLPPLRTFSRALKPALPDAPRQVRQIRGALAQLATLVDASQRKRLIGALTTTFTDLPTLVQRLGNLLPVARPFLQCGLNRVVPDLKASVPDGSLSTGQPAYMEFAHALVGFAGTAQSFDGNGPVLRYDAGVSGSSVSLQQIPGLGQVLSSGPSLLQARPQWMGNGYDLKFNPAANCNDQPMPDLGSSTVTVRSTPVRGSGRKVTRHWLRSFTNARVRKLLGAIK